jgi:enamine deaminase RidA (YjgF/YER057c/UK114 family)
MMLKKWIAYAAISLLATPSWAADVMRHSSSPEALILMGVTVPEGATTLYLSGALPSIADATMPATSVEAYGDTKTQTLSTLARIKSNLESLGWSMSDVVKLTVFLAGDPKLGGKMDFKGMNEAYAQYFGSATNPNKVARSTVQVAALVGPQFLIEIEAVAVKAKKSAKPSENTPLSE